MFLRKLTVILLPLAMLMLLCVLMPLFFSLSWYLGGLLIGLLLGVSLGLLLPLAGATRLREPFAWLLVFPAAVVVLILFYQYLASIEIGNNLPVLHLLELSDDGGAWYVTLESAFATYMLTFSIRTGRGI